MKKLLFMALTLPTLLISAELPEKIEWITENYPPYNYADGNDEPQGISIEILNKVLKIMKRANDKINVKPWPRGYSQAQREGQYNVLFSTTRTKERENLFKWFGPISKTIVSIWGHKIDKDFKFDKEDINNYQYCVIKNDIAELTLKELGVKEENLLRVDSTLQMLKLVMDRGEKKKKVDFLAYENNVISWEIKKNNLNLDEYSKVYDIKEGELWYSVNKTFSDEQLKVFQNAFDEALKDSDLKETLKSKFGI
jgi:polar amino acid transport system substrate-binding protein